MTDTAVPSALRVKQWDAKFFEEYVRTNRFSKYMGTAENSMIQLREDLTKKKGDRINFTLVNNLTDDDGITDNATLEGQEEAMETRSWELTVHQYRKAVRVPDYEEQASPIDLREAARSRLMDWSLNHTRNKIIRALGSMNGVLFNATSNAQRDAWLVDNSDRVLFGGTIANTGTDWSTALGTIDATDDKFTNNAVGIMKRLAKQANPRIRPIRVNGDEEWYVAFAPSYAFRDFKASMDAVHRDAGERGRSNPLFTDGDLIYDGVIVREIPEIGDSVNGLALAASAVDGSAVAYGNGIAVAPVFLCGAQALGVAYARRWQSVQETFDYGDKYGVGIRGTYEVGKTIFGKGATDLLDLVQHGVVTGYFSNVASAG